VPSEVAITFWIVAVFPAIDARNVSLSFRRLRSSATHSSDRNWTGTAPPRDRTGSGRSSRLAEYRSALLAGRPHASAHRRRGVLEQVRVREVQDVVQEP